MLCFHITPILWHYYAWVLLFIWFYGGFIATIFSIGLLDTDKDTKEYVQFINMEWK